MEQIVRPQLIYSPVIANGKPDFFSDIEKQEWIAEERRRCIEGYQPEGFERITGRMYFYLNHYRIMRLPIAWDKYKGQAQKILAQPLYRDIDHLLFNKIEIALTTGRNLILGKRRRAGVTEVLVACLIYEMLFRKFSKSVYAVPEQKYLNNAFYPKFNKSYFSLDETMFQRLLTDNPDEKFVGYMKPSSQGEKISGTQSTLYLKYFSNAGVVKGADAGLIIIDESGQFVDNPHLKSCYLETKEGSSEGGKIIGSIIIAGTSDKINNKNNDYQDLYENAESYHMDSLFLSAAYWYTNNDTKEEYFDLSTGKSDLERATQYILEESDRLYNLEDHVAYYKFKQNHPLEAADMWRYSESNEDSPLNMKTINKRIMDVTMDGIAQSRIKIGDINETVDSQGIPTGKYVWQDNPKGRWRKFLNPINGIDYSGADIGGIDDVLKDKAPESKSKNAFVVWRRFTDASMISLVPALVYHWRTTRREDFFEDVIKGASYMNCLVAFEYIDDGLFNYLTKRGKLHLLKQYPMVNGKPTEIRYAARYSVKELAKSQIRARLVAWVDSVSFQNVCDLEVLRECANFEKENTDIISALGICFLFDNDIDLAESQRVTKIEPDKKKKRAEPNAFEWDNKNGVLVSNVALSTNNIFGWEQQVLQNHTNR